MQTNPEEFPQSNSLKKSRSFESDSKRIVRRHMENPEDIITDEDLINCRIGMTPEDAGNRPTE